MWTHISLNVQIVWDDALWRQVAVWQEDDGAEPVVIERSGRVPLGSDRSPGATLLACARSAVRAEAVDAGQVTWR